jgi:hypothetical protein
MPDAATDLATDLAATDLAATQRWMLDAITIDGDRAGDLFSGTVVAGSAALSASQRIEIYRRGYRARLVDCLRKTHPGLRHVLGDDVFDAFALDYLAAQPSRSYTLGRLGANWPAHLEETRPDRDSPQRERWPDFLVDLARLESLFQEVYDGPGVEGGPILGPDDVPSEPWAALTVRPVACLRLLPARFPVAGYLAAVRRGEDPPLPAPGDSFVAVSRRDWVVTLTELPPHEHAALAALAAGEQLDIAARTAGCDVPELWQLVRDWADRGFLQAIDPPGPRAPVQLSNGEVLA